MYLLLQNHNSWPLDKKTHRTWPSTMPHRWCGGPSLFSLSLQTLNSQQSISRPPLPNFENQVTTTQAMACQELVLIRKFLQLVLSWVFLTPSRESVLTVLLGKVALIQRTNVMSKICTIVVVGQLLQSLCFSLEISAK